MKFISHIIKAVLLISMLFTMVACGDDDEPLPYMVDIVGGPIDWTDDSEDGMLFMQVTVFDYKGDPATDGNVIFTLNESSRGSLSPTSDLKSLSVDIEDGDVVEGLFYASKAPETVTMKVYIPGYPVDEAVSKTFYVINDTVEADFNYVDLGNQIIQFYDRSGYANEDSVPTFAWDFSDDAGASPQNSTARDPICEFSAGDTYDIVLSINGGASTITIPVVVP